MAVNCVDGWLLAKQKRQNGLLWIDVADKGHENDCGASCNCWCHIGIAVGGDQDGVDDAILLEGLVDDDEFELMLLTLRPLPPEFLGRVSVLSL